MPVQHAPLERRHHEVHGEPEEAGGDRERVQLVVEAVRLRVVHRLAETRRPHEELGGEGEDERDGRRDPQAGRDVRHRARERDAVEALELAEPEGARGVDRDRIDVPDAVDRLHEQRPEGAERGQEDLALQRRAEREEEERDQHRRGNRPQELDRHPERAPGQLARAEQDPDRNGEHGRDRQAERPAAHGVGEVPPELAGLHQRPELLHRRAHRGQVVLRDQPRAHDDLPEHKGPEHGGQRQEEVGGRRRAGGARRHVPFRDHRAARDLPSDDHCVLYIARDVEYPRHRSSSRDRTPSARPA